MDRKTGRDRISMKAERITSRGRFRKGPLTMGAAIECPLTVDDRLDCSINLLHLKWQLVWSHHSFFFSLINNKAQSCYCISKLFGCTILDVPYIFLDTIVL